MTSFKINTDKRIRFVCITSRIQEIISQQGVSKGVCFIFCPHTTAGLTINENADPAVSKDINKKLKVLIPARGDYSHAEGNSDAHIKSSLFGPELTVIIENGKIVLGTWQSIYFCEFDGPRTRTVYVKVMEG
jgi:secondary thiamine-phosphate synthase enzyme